MRELRSFSGFTGGTFLAICALALAACGSEPERAENPVAPDPLLARALNDPLMVDPDLAYRNQAAAALTIGADHALPVLSGNAEMARRVRDEMRLELLEDGTILDLPKIPEGAEGVSLADKRTAVQMAQAHGAPKECAEQLRAGFIWAARLEPVAAIMPDGHVRAGAGAQSGDCSIRVISYLTPAEGEVALQYYFNLADRNDMETEIFNQPEMSLVGKSEQAQLAVNIREGRNAMRIVDLIYWTVPQ